MISGLSLVCRFLAVVSAVVAFALSAAIAPVVKADVADREWKRITSAQPRLGRTQMVTDLPYEQARELLVWLDRFDLLVDQFVQPFVPLARKIAPQLAKVESAAAADELRLVVMRRRKDFNRLFRSGHFAAFTIPTLTGTTLVVGPMGIRESLRENLMHEYVHYRLRRDVAGGLPLWFEEGLASFLSQAELVSDETQAGAYRFELGRWNASEQAPDMPLKSLIALRDIQGMGPVSTYRFYRTAHALVRYLYVHAEVDRTALAESLVIANPGFPNGVAVDLGPAAAALEGLAPPTGRGRSMRYRKQGRVQREARLVGDRLPPERQAAELSKLFEVAGLRGNEVREILGDATLLMNPQASERLYARVYKVAVPPASAGIGYARALRLQAKKEQANKVLAGLVQDHGQEPAVVLEQSALSTSGCILQRRPDCRALWQKSVFDLRDVLDAQPDNFDAIYRLGLAHLYIGEAGEALGYLEIAWSRVPWSPRVNYFMGEALRLLGDSRARWYLQNALRWAASDYFRQSAEASLAALDQSAR